MTLVLFFVEEARDWCHLLPTWAFWDIWDNDQPPGYYQCKDCYWPIYWAHSIDWRIHADRPSTARTPRMGAGS